MKFRLRQNWLPERSRFRCWESWIIEIRSKDALLIVGIEITLPRTGRERRGMELLLCSFWYCSKFFRYTTSYFQRAQRAFSPPFSSPFDQPFPEERCFFLNLILFLMMVPPFCSFSSSSFQQASLYLFQGCLKLFAIVESNLWHWWSYRICSWKLNSRSWLHPIHSPSFWRYTPHRDEYLPVMPEQIQANTSRKH